MPKSTCQACKRTVLMVPIGGELVATDPELMNVVPATHVMGDSGSSIRMGTRSTPARRLHVERCEDYQNQARRERIQTEMRQFNAKQQGRAGRSARKNRGL